ncbi:hypothetical protein [Paraburkholderia hospita]|uniref:hypothetical protein n=1 Tax=Paraburkholderia hospita TaxID=169430 RepID=UPI0026B4B353
MKRISVLIVICSALSACISAGVDVKPEQLSKFKQDVTTLEEVVTELGSPTAQTALRDGSTVLIYSFVTSRPRPESFIPFIGPLFGGADTQSSTVVFEFDENGILTSERRTTSSGAQGLSAKMPGIMPPQPDQTVHTVDRDQIDQIYQIYQRDQTDETVQTNEHSQMK